MGNFNFNSGRNPDLGIIESLSTVGRSLGGLLVHPPSQGRNPQAILDQWLPNLGLKSSSGGPPVAPGGRLFLHMIGQEIPPYVELGSPSVKLPPLLLPAPSSGIVENVRTPLLWDALHLLETSSRPTTPTSFSYSLEGPHHHHQLP